MLLSAVSVLVVAQSSSEIPEGLMNNPVETFVLSNYTTFSAYKFNPGYSFRRLAVVYPVL